MAKFFETFVIVGFAVIAIALLVVKGNQPNGYYVPQEDHAEECIDFVEDNDDVDWPQCQMTIRVNTAIRVEFDGDRKDYSLGVEKEDRRYREDFGWMSDYLGTAAMACFLGMIPALVVALAALKGDEKFANNISDCSGVTLSIGISVAWFCVVWVWFALGTPGFHCDVETEQWGDVKDMEDNECVKKCATVHKGSYESACTCSEAIYAMFDVCLVILAFASLTCCGSCNVQCTTRKRKVGQQNNTVVTYIVNNEQQVQQQPVLVSGQAVAVPMGSNVPVATVVTAQPVKSVP